MSVRRSWAAARFGRKKTKKGKITAPMLDYISSFSETFVIQRSLYLSILVFMYRLPTTEINIVVAFGS